MSSPPGPEFTGGSPHPRDHADQRGNHTTISFREWLRSHHNDPDPVGDLARDVLADPTWPRGPGSLARYEGYLRDCDAMEDAIDALHVAWYRNVRATGR